MSAAFGTLALMAVAGLGFAAGTSLVLAAAWPILGRRLRRGHPEARAWVALAAAIAPTVVPMVLLGLCLAPGALGLLGLHADHCVQHPGHPHLCLVHPTAMLTASSALLLGLVLALVAGGALGVALRAARTRRVLAGLRNAPARCLAPGVRCIESERAFSLTAGLGRGEIFVSRALADALAPAHLDAVIEHERAHARRRDGLRRLAAQILSWPHLPAVRRAILAELEMATEQACDEEAGRRLGDRLIVAEAILAAERLVASASAERPGPLLAFGGSAVPARVHGLLAEPVARPGPAGWWMAGGLLVVASLLTDPLHHATEHVLGQLLGLH
ncbi:M56 family metallopeptidase [Myxococcota bacterium]|nr:M56 family metallopeptidase [Myxococcota bacterium]MCZ7619446.1 M56 family metallopeptidase [Myxococcota bacterium]